jgi:hypothetical protein
VDQEIMMDKPLLTAEAVREFIEEIEKDKASGNPVLTVEPRYALWGPEQFARWGACPKGRKPPLGATVD